MSERFIPRPWQEPMVEHIINTPRCGVWSFMGSGKSSGSLAALNKIDAVEDAFPALVMAPLRVAQTTWPDEVTKWDQFAHYKVSAIVGDLGERMAALRRPAHIYTVNYEQIPWLVDLYGHKWPFRNVISDEATRLKSFRIQQGGKRTHELYKVAFKYIKRFIELTGTPSPNGLQDLHGQLYFLDNGKRLGTTYTAFMERWFQRSWDGYGADPLPFAQKEIQELIKDICISIRAQDYFNLADPIVVPVYVDLPPEARALYKKMEREMFFQYMEKDFEAFAAAGKRNKCCQIANGACYFDEGDIKDYRVIHDEKIKALESIIAESGGMPIIVAYYYKSDLKRLMKAFPKGKLLDDKPQTIHDWNKGRIPLLFAHPASAGHGLNLQNGGNILVRFSFTDNLEHHLQILERIGPVRQMQAGFDRPVFEYRIIARNTVEDYAVIPNLEGKDTLQNLLIAAMSRINNET